MRWTLPATRVASSGRVALRYGQLRGALVQDAFCDDRGGRDQVCVRGRRVAVAGEGERTATALARTVLAHSGRAGAGHGSDGGVRDGAGYRVSSCRRTRCARMCCATRPTAPAPRAGSRPCATTHLPGAGEVGRSACVRLVAPLVFRLDGDAHGDLNTLRGLLRELGFSIPVGVEC